MGSAEPLPPQPAHLVGTQSRPSLGASWSSEPPPVPVQDTPRACVAVEEPPTTRSRACLHMQAHVASVH